MTKLITHLRAGTKIEIDFLNGLPKYEATVTRREGFRVYFTIDGGERDWNGAPVEHYTMVGNRYMDSNTWYMTRPLRETFGRC